MWNDPVALHFVDRRGVAWRVVERLTPNWPDTRGRRCLIVLCEAVVRRVWKYPENWRQLSALELETMGERALV